MYYDLPKTVDIREEKYDIRYDFRPILDIISAINDPDLDEQEKAYVMLYIFYPEFDTMPSEHYDEAIKKCINFINCGKEEEERSSQSPRVMDWEQDFDIIVSPINRVLGYEIRATKYNYENNTGGVHWFTFCSAYQEIGDCTFAQVIRIRDHKARGKALDKTDQEFYRRNRQMVDLKTKYTPQEDAVLDKWLR